MLDRAAGQAVEACREVVGYGDDDPAYGKPRYLLGRAHQSFDGAGLAEVLRCDFAGNHLNTSRRFLAGYLTEPDWSAVAAAPPAADRSPSAGAALEPGAGAQIQVGYDALDRPVRTTGADGSVVEVTRHPGGEVASVHLTPRGGPRRAVLDRARYDALRRRELVGYGPAGGVVEVRRDYDPLTWRVTRILATRPGEPGPVQDLRFGYNVVGNLLQRRDLAQDTQFFVGAVVTPDREYGYDDLYRLTSATGRELVGLTHTSADSGRQPPVRHLPDAADLQAVVRYRENYDYDDGGNLTALRHVQQVLGGASWVRSLTPEIAANRLAATTVSGDTAGSDALAHDDRGNLTRLGSVALTWGWHNAPADAVVSGNVTAYYHYAADGTRVRKVVVAGARVEERRYVGSTEFDTVAVGGVLTEAVETVRVAAGGDVVALAERATRRKAAQVEQAPVLRYQLGDQLNSTVLELDDAGHPLTYEEFHPYGTTAYESRRPGVGVSRKRYRFTAKERDDETGLQYHGARYYAPWLGRWLSPDPAGLMDGGNRYAYCRGNPACLTDPHGRQGGDPNRLTITIVDSPTMVSAPNSGQVSIGSWDSTTGRGLRCAAPAGGCPRWSTSGPAARSSCSPRTRKAASRRIPRGSTGPAPRSSSRATWHCSRPTGLAVTCRRSGPGTRRSPLGRSPPR